MNGHKFPAVLILLSLVTAVTAGSAQESSPSRIFTGRETAIEDCLRTAKVVKYRDLGVGITRPARVYFEPGGACASALWKSIRPGMYKGFWDSYKSEIAAYALDLLLQLQMVPPSIERRLNGVRGALMMWIDDVRSWKDAEAERPVTRAWDDQVVRMQMFDALIGNIDRNPGNVLVDAGWTMYLIDHSRAFTQDHRPPVTLIRVDPALWERMQGLDEARLTAALGPWLDRNRIRAILARRDRMARRIGEIAR